MSPDTYSFSGNAITYIGLVGVASTLLIVVVAFRRFFNSPYNTQYRPMNDDWEWEDDCMPPWGHSDLEYMIRHSDDHYDL